MSDIIIPESDDVFEGLEPAASITETEAVQQPEVAAEPEATPEPDMFPRSYVEELRKESAQYRTQYREMESKFDGYTEDERAALLDYIHLIRKAESGDPEAEAALQEMFAEEQEPEPIQTFDEATFRALAREEAARLVQEQTAQQAQVQAVQGVQARATELGYTVGSEDYILLLRFANEANSEDPIGDGHAKVAAYKQSIIDQHLKAIQNQNAGVATPTATNGAAPTAINEPKTFEDARNSLHERLTRQFG
jgi:hypothetical protein